MLSTLIYSSQSKMLATTSTASWAAMDDIRATATRRNALLGITGFLFHFEDRFVQILEGEFEAVTQVFGSIRRDQRHANCRIVWFAETADRKFDDWSMDGSMSFIAGNNAELNVKLRFIGRFVADTSQTPILLRDLLVSVATEMQSRRDFPRPRLVS